MDTTKYIVRGFTSANPDFTYEWEAETGCLHGQELREMLLGHLAADCGWGEAIADCGAYELSEEGERGDLRDNEEERVYVFNTVTYPDDSDDSDGGDCFMVIVAPAK